MKKNNTESETTEIALVFDDAIDASENKEEYRYILSEIRIRSEATKNGEIVGHVYEGEHYKVLDTKTNEGFTWYCIGDDKWIADDGTWTSKFYNIHFKSNNRFERSSGKAGLKMELWYTTKVPFGKEINGDKKLSGIYR